MFEDHCSEAKENSKVSASYHAALHRAGDRCSFLCFSMSVLWTRCPRFFNCPSYEMVPSLILSELCFVFLEFALKCDAQNGIECASCALTGQEVGQNEGTKSSAQATYYICYGKPLIKHIYFIQELPLAIENLV